MPERCRAHSSRTGEPCKLPPIRGATVCRNHGGAIKRVKRAAAERLREMIDPLLDEYFRIALSGESDTVRLAAIRDALDRAGYKPSDKAEVDHQVTITVSYEDVPVLSMPLPLPGAADDDA